MSPTVSQIRTLLPSLSEELSGPLDDWNYLHVTYEHPHVQRLWRVHGEGRLLLHVIDPVPENDVGLWHPHPWTCATLILKGGYEMEASEDDTPSGLNKMYFVPGSGYEMHDSMTRHVVQPWVETWTVMLTGKLFAEPIPVTRHKRSPGTRTSASEVRPLVDSWVSLLKGFV